MLVGAALIGVRNFIKVGKLFCWSLIANGIILILLGRNQHLFGGLILYFLFAFTDALAIPAFTYLQLYVEDEKKGRVFALFDTIVLFSSPLASLALGLLVSGLGILRSYIVAGAAIVSIGLLSWRLKHIRSADLSELINKPNSSAK
jgi:sugar phosphate permease